MDRADPNIIPVSNETDSEAIRETQAGARLAYRLRVIQQPARARACGSGQKSSADRRPVDPPPIVELKIFDQKAGSEEEITFKMNANYFLFAALEQARPIAHGRVSQDRAQPTVLTGTPVAGMSYLDRPSPAGYFIFPDLSVRHEGKYRLSFSLYEELKETKDEDKNPDPTGANGAKDAHVVHRLEVRSKPFTVYSAKKFPGLSSSTSLSRMVAEQGCRVRIRREVRMRKRDTKSGKDWEAYEDDTAQARARMSATPLPDPYGYQALSTRHGSMDPIPRPRSASNASHHSLAASISRRPSLQEIGQAYQQAQYGAAAPQTPQHGYPQVSPYGPSPTTQFPQPAYMQQPMQSMQPPPPQFQTPGYPPPPMPAAASQQSYYSYPPAPAVQHHNPSISSQYDANRLSVDYSAQAQPEYRRSSLQQPAPYNTQQTYPAPQQQSQQSYASQTSQPYTSMDSYGSRPLPLEPSQSIPRTNTDATPLSARPSFGNLNTLPPINTSVLGGKIEASSPMSAGPSSAYFGSSSASFDTHKRSYGNTFPTSSSFAQPLKAGARPTTPYSGYGSTATGFPSATTDDDDEDGECDIGSNMPRMAYRRADGKMMSRPVVDSA